MVFLGGRISDMIRGGLLPGGVQVVGPRVEADDRPYPWAVLRADGHHLGAGGHRTYKPREGLKR